VAVLAGVLEVVGGLLLTAGGALVLGLFTRLSDQRISQLGTLLLPFGPRRWRSARARLVLGCLAFAPLAAGVLTGAFGISQLRHHRL
jgi:hypothetical protein